MSLYLYRLGRLAARRAWAVLAVWILLLAGMAGAAGTLGKPFATGLTIPGTEFQSVLDDLKTAVPDSSGGSGTVMFRDSQGRPLSQAQKNAIARTIGEWDKLPGVVSTRNPFTTQQDLNEAVTKVADAKTDIADGRKQVRDNTAKLNAAASDLDDGQDDVAENTEKLTDGQTKLAQGRAKIADGQKTLDANAAKIADGKVSLEQNAAKLADGRTKLDQGATQLAQGQAQLDANAAKITDGKAQLAAAQKKLTDGRTQAQAGRARLEAGKAQLAQAQREVAQNEAAAAAAAQAGQPLPADQLAAIAAARRQVDAQAAQLAAGEKELDASEAKLDAGAAQLAQKQAELRSGEKQLDAARARLAAGRQDLASGRARLDAGQKQLDEGRVTLAEGEKKLTAGQSKVSAGAAEAEANAVKLAQGQAKLENGKIQILEGRQQIAEGRAKLLKARGQLVAGAADLKRGERRLALIEGIRTVSRDGTTAVGTITFDTPTQSVAKPTLKAIPERGAELAAAGVTVDYSQDLLDRTGGLAGPGEVIGLAIAAVVLLVMLGSLLAAGLPLVTALVGVGVGLLTVLAATHWFSMNDVTPILALMLGLAVGIDYALFLVNRHREQLAAGLGVEESIGRATGTAGSAVTIAGATVVVALAALTFSGIPFLGTMGLAAAFTVAVSVLVSLTLTPALLSLIGPRVLSRRSRRALAARLAEVTDDDADREPAPQARHTATHGARGWGAAVTRHPVIALVLSTLLLGVLALPAASLRLGLPDGGSEPADSSAYRTYSTVSQQFGPGQNAAILAVARIDGKTARTLSADALTDLQLDVGERLHSIEGVHYVVPAGTSKDHTRLLFQVVPETGPSDEATVALVDRLRADRADILDETGVRSLNFAGQTVANIDMSQLLANALPTYLLIVVGISIVLLLLVFRSVVVPVLATAGFLLSIAAAFGSVVAVYQWGWLGSWFAVDHPGPILSFLPTLAIGIVFGLAMDYQMFLVSGMREAWAHGQDARTAVRSGFSHGARVVTAAALIMTSVFGSFVFSHSTMIRPIGFALAMGVVFDAFVVRMTIMPAVMHLLGERAWYIPAWLDRVLPDLDVEGAHLAEKLDADHDAPGDAVSGVDGGDRDRRGRGRGTGDDTAPLPA